jgi:hypothetical protein
VREGVSDVYEAMIAGDSRPIRKDRGGRVIAGTVNGSGSPRVDVTGVGRDESPPECGAAFLCTIPTARRRSEGA